MRGIIIGTRPASRRKEDTVRRQKTSNSKVFPRCPLIWEHHFCYLDLCTLHDAMIWLLAEAHDEEKWSKIERRAGR